MGTDTTTIQVSIENYKRLNGLKNPGDSFDDVIGKVLTDYESTGDDIGENEQVSENPSATSADQATDGAAKTSDEGPTKHTAPSSSERSRQLAFDTNDDLDDRLDDAVEQALIELNLSTSAGREKWIPAIRAAHRYLADREQASKQEFIDDVYPDTPAGYDNEETWWRKVIRPGLAELPRIEKPQAGGKWQYERAEE
jgi:hypothetical protein